MQFACIGIRYTEAKLSVRDKISFTDAMKLAFFDRAEAAGVDQCMVLSTCNRSEAYYFYTDEGQKAQMRRIYMEMFPEADTGRYLNETDGEKAIAYLFAVAAGLESMVPGEDQILGQVKEALDYARTMGYAGKELNRTVRDAVTCAKRIKTELNISAQPLSAGYVGIRMLQEYCGIAGKRALVIGSGKTAALAVKYVSEYGAAQIVACSRTRSHAARLCMEVPETEIVSYESRYTAMADCDIVISATASPHFVVRREEFCPQKPIAFLDLAAPRDIDPAYADDPLVHLIDLDILQETVSRNYRERRRLAEQGRGRIAADVRETAAWLMQSRMDSTIESLQQRCGAIAEDSFAYLDRKMQLGAREQKLLKKVLNASLQRLMREPIRELKRLDTEEEQEAYKQMVRQLFQI